MTTQTTTTHTAGATTPTRAVADRGAARDASGGACAYANLNLRFNPFGELDPDDRVTVAVVDVDRWTHWLASPCHAVVFLGDRGRGKTTHLLAIHAAWQPATYHHFPEVGPAPTLPDTGRLCVDELQRFSRWRRRRWMRRVAEQAGSIAIGSHVDHQRELQAAGFQVITHRPAAALTPALLVEAMNRRIAYARRHADQLPIIDTEAATALIRDHGDDVRAIEHRLYDIFQSLTEPGHVQV